MFKERLKITFYWLLMNIIVPIVSIVGIAMLMGYFPTLLNITGWVLLSLLGIALLFGFYRFVIWLFIEPFKKAKERD